MPGEGTTTHDVFLSHNSGDKPAVIELAEALKARGLRPWLDVDDLVPGRPWQKELENIIETVPVAIVATGQSGIGPWEEQEIWGLLSEYARRKQPVIPVLLPGAPEKPELPLFLRSFIWVDLRDGITEVGIDRLVWGITGEKPEPRPPADEILAPWWDHVAAKHRRLADHFDRPAELEIIENACVEVAVEMRPEHLRRAEAMALKGELPSGPLTIDEVLALESGGAPWITGRWLLEGEPGSGKTTLLRRLAGRLAAARDPGRIPIFVSLPRLVEGRTSLLDHLTAGFALRGHDGVGEALQVAGGEGRLVVLLDGLDEVPPERRDGIESLLQDLPGDWPGSPIILASRPLGQGDVPKVFSKLKLLPLGTEERQEFLVKWFRGGEVADPEGAASEAMEHFARRPGLRELAGNPLYLTLLAVLWEGGVEAPERRVDLYDEIFELLFEDKHKPKKSRRPIPARENVRLALCHLAYGMTRDDHPDEAPSQLENRLLEPELHPVRQFLFQVDRWHDRLRTFLDDVYERTQILGPHDGDDEKWRFWHRTFREALAAEKLEALLAAEGEEALFAKVQEAEEDKDEGRWAEPFALLAGRLGDGADRFLLRLNEANGQLARRALGTAQGTRPATLREMLSACKSWRERREIYPQISEQFDAPAAGLAFLDELRRETRDGNDLFFLDEAVRLTGERWPDAADAAEKLRGRLYDHISSPEDPELFRSIETPKDGRVGLWCEIPADEGWIGAADGEENWDYERPRHRVEVVRPYRMGAVPVTVAQFAAFQGEDPPEGEKSLHPVDSVTWYAAMSFCRWLASLPSFEGARLPTEEEWEYACRAGTETRYWKGDEEKDLDEVGWYGENSGHRTHRVGEKLANEWGLYDVHGNVWEWTMTEWDSEAYKGREDGITIDPAAPAGAASHGGLRVVRGGSCWVTADWARSACRSRYDPGSVFGDQGFRVLLPRP